MKNDRQRRTSQVEIKKYEIYDAMQRVVMCNLIL